MKRKEGTVGDSRLQGFEAATGASDADGMEQVEVQGSNLACIAVKYNTTVR
jgi:hypothetical protein